MAFSEELYKEMIDRLFVRFPSFQKVGGDAYKPGILNMECFDGLLGHPHRKYKTVHIAGTNGKGSVSSMLASVLAAAGLKTGLYTSPHIIDFRERMRIINGRNESAGAYFISEREVWDFIENNSGTFDHLNLSFFEITTMMAFDWFAKQEVDIAVIETGLGGRLDSTNIIVPELSVITNIGLDHCDMLGETLPEIAFEKAGIIKPEVPVVVGESSPETDGIFSRKVLYTNLPSAEFMGDRTRIMSLLTFADKVEPPLWENSRDILADMDLKGDYQEKNLRTVLSAADVLFRKTGINPPASADIVSAIENTAKRTDFHGRWEKLSESPLIIGDIGHNAHGLKYNFAQLRKMLAGGVCSHLIIIYGMVADKDADAVFGHFPENAEYYFTNASGKRALSAQSLLSRYESYCKANGRPVPVAYSCDSVALSVSAALQKAWEIRRGNPMASPLIYIGGSTYVLSEAIQALNNRV